MGEDIQLHLPSIRECGSGLGAHADRLRSAWDQFSAQVAGQGDIFGDDQIGALIGMSYQVAHGIADESYRSVADAFEDRGAGLHAMADAYEDADATCRDEIDSV
jgi:hypothetical protein